MTPPEPRDSWSRLIAAARPASRDEREDAAPYGFATRVAALALHQDLRVVSLLERFALKAVGAACLLAVLGVVVNYPALLSPPAQTISAVDDEDLPTDDAISVALDFSD